MSANNRTILKDEKKNQFVFNNEAFSSKIKKLAYEKEENSIRKTSNSIIQDLSDYIYCSYDTVKKWYYGNSGPNSINTVYKIAEYFKIDSDELLVSLINGVIVNPTKDKELVENIFRKALDIFISAKNYASVDENDYQAKQEEAQKELSDLHMNVNAESLSTSEMVRNRLHKLILEIVQVFDSNWNYELNFGDWYSDWKSFPNFLFTDKGYNGYSSRDEYFKSEDFFASNYIYDEIELANELKLGNVVETDDKFRNLDDDSDEFQKYGYHGELEITPKFIYQQMFCNALTEIFKKAFEDLF